MRRTLGGILVGLGYLGMIVFGLWALALDLRILSAVGGFWLAVVGFFLFPFMLALAPFYAAFVLGDWTPLTVTIIGTLQMWLFLGLGMAVINSARKSQIPGRPE